MDLSKQAKTRRDRVEAPLFRTEKLLDDLDEIRRRIDAAMKVWNETTSTLAPALGKIDAVARQLEELKKELACLWEQGRAGKWK